MAKNNKTDIQKFIDETKSTTRAIRKDAVLVNEWIISSDKDFFDNLTKGEIEIFFERSKDYFAEKFGENNIRYATVHLDESTPHMHMGIVPFDDDNKLSAKRVFNRQALRDVQEELPQYLQEFQFEIERGVKGSVRKNLTVPEFKEMKKEQQEIEREIERNKKELKAYVKDRKVKMSIDEIKASDETKEVKVPSGEKFLGHEFSKTVSEKTGNVVMSKQDFNKIKDFNSYIRKSESRLLNLLDTDFYKENKELKKELEEQKKTNNENIDDYNELVRDYNSLNEENTSLKSQVSNLKAEIRLIYESTKNFLKERTSDLKAFKNVFKELADSISIKSKEKSLDSNFKREFDKENKKERTRGRSR